MSYILSKNFRSELDLLVQANQKREQGDYEAALTIYQQLQQKTGESADLLAAQANCHFGIALDQGEVLDPADSPVIKLMQQAINLSPNDARLYVNLAWYYCWGTSEYEKSLDTYHRALEINPDLVEALVGAASLYDRPDEVISPQQATEYLEKAVQLAPNDESNWYNLAILYAKTDKIAQAEQALTKSLLSQKTTETKTVVGNWIDPGLI